MSDQKDIDEVSGIETTGHEWDGIKELNNPLPRWWLYIFYATIAWAVGYWILMPAWPLVSGYTAGLLGYSDRAEVVRQLEGLETIRAPFAEPLLAADYASIEQDPELLQFALASGASAFGDNCATCHGSGAQGFVGYPNLNDDAWIWGGSYEAIAQTIRYGINNENFDSRISLMPAFGADGILERDQIAAVAEYVLTLSDTPDVNPELAARGAEVYAQECASCHGENGLGMREVGAPNLADSYWLWGEGRDAINAQITQPSQGVMPPWFDRLDDATIKALAIYVHALGGGEGPESQTDEM